MAALRCGPPRADAGGARPDPGDPGAEPEHLRDGGEEPRPDTLTAFNRNSAVFEPLTVEQRRICRTIKRLPVAGSAIMALRSLVCASSFGLSTVAATREDVRRIGQ